MKRIKPPSLTYRLLSILLLPFWVVHACWHALKHRQPDYVAQRLGITRSFTNKSVWLHASSVGEVELVKPLIQTLSTDHSIMLTTFTASGYQHARRTMPAHIVIRILPIDFLPLSWLFVRRHFLKLGLIAETELWPETLYQAASSGLPLLRINARMSARSDQSPKIIKSILRRTLCYFDLHLTRNLEDETRLLAMGVDHDKIKICGNLKQAGVNVSIDQVDLVGRPYILFASTHAPEERLFASLMQEIDTGRLTVIAPRHPQRAGEILKELAPLNLEIRQRSKGQPIEQSTDIYLADTLGELKGLMAHADLVVMGGSFNDIGGHNILEPARLGKAIITGPSDNNIRTDIEMLLEHEGIIQTGIEELPGVIASLMKQPERLATLGTNALVALKMHQHVLEDYLKEIEYYLPSS